MEITNRMVSFTGGASSPGAGRTASGKVAKNGMHIDSRGVAGVEEASPGIDIMEKA
jgi:hypothetical protein